MFNFPDFLSLLLSLMFIYPIVSFIHEMGHAFFAWIFGGKFTFSLGRGREIFKKGPFSLNIMYFLDSYCEYANLRWNNRFTHFLVHAGGIIFNLGTVFLLNVMIAKGILDHRYIYLRFSHFSVWLATFALVPVDYGKGNYSDGLAIYHVLRYNEWPKLTG